MTGVKIGNKQDFETWTMDGKVLIHFLLDIFDWDVWKPNCSWSCDFVVLFVLGKVPEQIGQSY